MLTDEERKDICEYLKNEMRGDMKWIQAVALTRKNVTKDIQIAITGNVFLDKEPKNNRYFKRKNILTECLHIFVVFLSRCGLMDITIVESIHYGMG